MKKAILLFFTIFLTGNPFAYSSSDSIKVENINVKISGSKMYIQYDLLGPIDEDYSVNIFLKRENILTFNYVPINVTGDIGNGKFAGMNKQIVWDLSSEFPTRLTGNDLYMIVNSKIIHRSISPWVWIGGGAAVLGSGAYFLLKKKTNDGETKIYLPNAPDRP